MPFKKRNSQETKFFHKDGRTALNTGWYYPTSRNWDYWEGADGSTLTIEAGYGSKLVYDVNRDISPLGSYFLDANQSEHSVAEFGPGAYPWTKTESAAPFGRAAKNGAFWPKETVKGTVPTAIKRRVVSSFDSASAKGKAASEEYAALAEQSKWEACS